MSRRNHSLEEDARRVMIRELLQKKNISSIQVLFKETITKYIKNGLEAELDNELGYSKYDYNVVSGHDRHYKKMDGSAAGLERHICPVARVFADRMPVVQENLA